MERAITLTVRLANASAQKGVGAHGVHHPRTPQPPAVCRHGGRVRRRVALSPEVTAATEAPAAARGMYTKLKQRQRPLVVCLRASVH